MDQCTKVRSQHARLKGTWVIVQGKGHRPPSLNGAKNMQASFLEWWWLVGVGGHRVSYILRLS